MGGLPGEVVIGVMLQTLSLPMVALGAGALPMTVSAGPRARVSPEGRTQLLAYTRSRHQTFPAPLRAALGRFSGRSPGHDILTINSYASEKALREQQEDYCYLARSNKQRHWPFLTWGQVQERQSFLILA